MISQVLTALNYSGYVGVNCKKHKPEIPGFYADITIGIS
jgi:hypothetical protein